MKNNLRNDQRGVAFLLELVIFMVVILGVGFAGYKIYKGRADANKPESSSTQVKPPQNPSELVQIHNTFGFEVMKNLEQSDGKNVVISPTSLEMALSMVYNGANGDTKTGMSKALALNGLGIKDLNDQSQSLIEALTKSDKDVQLKIANSAWIRKGTTIKPAFLKTAKDSYKAESKTLDFSSSSAPDTINKWVSKNTNGKIPTIVQNIPETAVMYLINATYFNGTWTTAFEESATYQGEFTSESKTVPDVSFMSRQDKMSYLENEDFQAVSLPYGKSKRFSMYVFLPKDLAKFVTSLSADNWNKWASQFTQQKGTLDLPRFKTEYEQQMSKVLSEMGMAKAFSDQANFEGIGKALKISQVKHKTYVDVKESGTEAAAATSVEVGITSAVGGGDSGFIMDVNQPFFFAITDNKSGEIIFTGTIHDPSS